MVKVHTKKLQQKQSSIQSIINAANEGCLLHQLYIDECINEAQFQAGLAFAKLHSLAMRSFGIHNRIRTAAQSWDKLHGITYDQFSNRKIEGLWRYILKALDPTYHYGTPMREIAFKLILTIQSPRSYTIDNIRKTLDYLHTVWEKIESGPYRLGLFIFEQQPICLKLH